MPKKRFENDGYHPQASRFWGMIYGIGVTREMSISAPSQAEMNNCLLMLLHHSADFMAGVSKQVGWQNSPKLALDDMAATMLCPVRFKNKGISWKLWQF